jgi:hypothetical protein
VLSAGRGRPARTPFALLVWALSVVVPPSRCGVCCVPLIGPRICWRVGGTRDISVEALFPQDRERFELRSSGWSRVLGIDAVARPPHCDFADEGDARVTSCCSPGWPAVTVAGLVLDLVPEVGDQFGSLCQIGPPDGIGMKRWWNAPEPGQRTWIGRRVRCEAPVDDGRHVACGFEVASGGGRQQVAERVLSSFGHEGQQLGSQGWPGRFGGESRNVLVGLVELCNGPGAGGAVRRRHGGRRYSAGPPGKAGPPGW